jgi:ATP-binding cassette subfamily C (CFTR/MRP) protein 1
MFMIQRWLTLVLDLLSSALAVIVVAITVKLRGTSSIGLIAVALVNLISFNDTIKSLVLVWTMFETTIGAISRIMTFSEQTPTENLPTESEAPPDNWPQSGTIEIRGISAAYG